MTLSNKNFVKFSFAFTLILFLGLASVLVINSEKFSEWASGMRPSKENNKLAEFYRENLIGGETPYEVFDFFLAALEAGDVYSASEYFVSETREDWKKKLEGIKDEGGLNAQVNEWKKIRHTFEEVRDEQSDWDKHAVIKYKILIKEGFDLVLSGEDGENTQIFIEPGEYVSNILFARDAVSGLWKMISL